MNDDSPREQSQRSLITLFAILYFVQGTAEPTAGLVSQPVRSLLRSWGQGADEIASVMFIVGIPWTIKPLFGLLTDFVPIRRLRRKSYLVITSLVSALGLFGAALLPLPEGSTALLVVLLFLPTMGIAFSDVVTDGHMVDTGKPRGLTGRLQSAQWTAIYGAGFITGVGGGYLSQHGLQRLGFAICGTFTLLTLFMALTQVKERAEHEIRRDQLAYALRALREAVTNRAVLVIASFLFLINFNPFSADVLYVHMTEALGFSDQFVGNLYTVSSAGSVAAGILYGLLSTRIPMRRLVHASIALMVLSSLVYLGMAGAKSAVAVSLLYGFVYLLTTLIQLDLAARYCPSASAGTIFAALMSVINLSVISSSVVGGTLYTWLSESWGAGSAFTLVVFVGAGFTAMCWILYHFFPLERQA